MAKRVKARPAGGHEGSISREEVAPAKRKIIGVHVKKAKGGHVVSHSYDNYGPGNDPEHVFGKGQHKKLMNHVARKIGVPTPYADDADGDAAADAQGGNDNDADD